MSEQPLEDNPEAHVDLTAPDLLDAKEWEHWLKMPAWTIKEFACLMHSINPDEAERTTGIFSRIRRTGNNNVSLTFQILERAKAIRQIKNMMMPIKFINWALSCGFRIPIEMESIVDETREPSPTKELEDRPDPKRAILCIM